MHAGWQRTSQTIIKHMAGKKFVTDADLKEAVTSRPQTLGTDIFYCGIQALAPRWNEFLNVMVTAPRSDV